jgi:hypothetical protein
MKRVLTVLFAFLPLFCRGVDYDRSKIPSVNQADVARESGGEIPPGHCYINARVNHILWWHELGLCRVPPGRGSKALRITWFLKLNTLKRYWELYGDPSYEIGVKRVRGLKYLRYVSGLTLVTLSFDIINSRQIITEGHEVTVVSFNKRQKRLKFKTWGKEFTVNLGNPIQVRDCYSRPFLGYKVMLKNYPIRFFLPEKAWLYIAMLRKKKDIANN